jgi:ion channel-forming bestrophin family protein
MLLNKKIPFKYLFNKIKYDVLTVIAVASIILFITSRYAFALPEIPLTIPMFLGTAISILLSFKLSQSYDRWWEARKVWGSIVNDSRSLIIQLNGFVINGNAAAIKKIAYRQIAWCYSLSQSLRGLDPLKDLASFIADEEMEAIQSHANKPLALLQFHSNDIKGLKASGQLDVFSQIHIDKTIIRLCDAQGKAERIKNTVFPVTYRKFLHYIIYLFLITLSISLNNLAYYYELPILLLISSAFFFLEKSATHMQDPFENKPTDTPMTSISKTIEVNLKQLINDKDVPAIVKPEGYFVM